MHASLGITVLWYRLTGMYDEQENSYQDASMFILTDGRFSLWIELGKFQDVLRQVYSHKLCSSAVP